MHAKTENRLQRLIVVSNRLPVSLERDDGEYIYNPSVGGLATILNAVREETDMLWLGAPASRGTQGYPHRRSAGLLEGHHSAEDISQLMNNR